MRNFQGGRDSEGCFTSAWIANTMVEAQIAQAALRDQEIGYLVETFQANPYDGALATQFGWGRILVRAQDVDRAREIIQDALTTVPISEEEPDTGSEAAEEDEGEPE